MRITNQSHFTLLPVGERVTFFLRHNSEDRDLHLLAERFESSQWARIWR